MCTESHLHFDYARLAWDSGFCFEESKNKSVFDMSVLGCVDVERVSRERDIITVEKHIPTILKFRLDEELAKILEPTFVKLFRLAQLGIQYLQFCNKYLDRTVIILKKDLSNTNEELTELQKCVEELQSQNDLLKQKHEDLRETIQTINTSVSFKCTDCPKAFSTDEYLQLHIKRRHENSQSAELQAESEKLQLEIKELKQRLNNTEKFIQTEKKLASEPNNDIIFEKEESVQEKFEKLQNHIEKELSTLRDEEFYRNIYEKWFEEVQKSQKKIFSYQGAGDCIRIRESSTQTAIFEGGDGSPSMSPKKVFFESKMTSNIDDKIYKKPEDEIKFMEKNQKSEPNEIIALSSNDTKNEPSQINSESSEIMPNESIADKLKQSEIHFEELQDQLKKEAEVQREKLEQVLDQKLAGSLERLETQMNTFYQKLSDMQLTKQEERKQNIPIETIFKKPHIPPKIIPRFNQTRYITNSKSTKSVSASSETESESQTSEDVPTYPPIIVIKEPPIPKPRSAPVKVIKKDNKAKHEPQKLKSEPIMVGPKNASTNKLSSNSGFVITRNDILDAKATLNKTQMSNQVKDYMEDTEETLDESEESEEQTIRKVNKKSSKTSTLGKRSVSSLKNAAEDEEVFDGLKEELKEVLHLQLKELGVAPQWKGLPDKSYNHAQSIVVHQASLAKRNSSFYSKVRDNIMKKMDTEVRKLGFQTGDIKKDLKAVKRHRKTERNKHIKKNNEEKLKASVKESLPTDIKTIDNLSSNESDIEIKTVRMPHDNISETPSKSVLKSHQQMNQWSNKKKVFFNLDSDQSVSIKDEIKVLDVGGSTSTIVSLSLEETKGKNKENLKKKDDDTSDWDISDIIT